MNSNVQKGKQISVLVEQAFTTCILVSFQQGKKTFRGVLLDESSQTVIRTTPCGVLGKADNAPNLGLTTARATTCQSNQQNTSTSRVSTRSSSMIIRDGKEGSLPERMTPVHKIQGLVECLKQRQKKVVQPTESGNPSSLTTGPTQKHTHSVRKQLLPRHNVRSLMPNSLKRKRDETSVPSHGSFCQSPKVRCKEDAKASNSSSPKKEKDLTKTGDITKSASLSTPQLSHQIPIFPVIKLKRTSENENNYVAVMTFSSQDGKECGAGKLELAISDQMTEKQSSNNQDTVHRHNTRFKARKGTENCQRSSISEINPDETKEAASFQNADALDRNTQVSSIRIKPKLKGNNKIYSGVISQSNSTPARQLKGSKKIQPSENIKVGDIVWGKVHGHPWWPGKVLGISCNASQSNGGSCQIVSVSWYGSPTMSDISCSSLLMFQENFNHLFKKRKTGAYRLAVRQAQHDLEMYMNGTQVMPA